MVSSMNVPLATLLLLLAITSPASSQGLGGLLGGILGGGGGGGLLGGATGGILGGVTGGILGGPTGLTGIIGNLLCAPNLILCPATSGSCPPLVNAMVSLNLGNVVLIQNVTNASGAFQLISALPIGNILSNLPALSISVALPASGCSTLPASGILSSPLAVTQVRGSILNVLTTGFLLN